jgi:predicted enzyme related to lactoylglutathione lyase
MEAEGMVLFIMPNGTMLELNAPQAVPDYGFNDGGVVFGFRVDDVEAASAAVEAAGCELLGEITRLEEMAYAYRHFRGPDGRVYGLNEQN